MIETTKQVFGEQEILRRVISDKSLHYDSTAFKQFAKEWGINHRISPPKCPQSNELTASFVQSIKSAIKKAKSSSCDIDIVLLCLWTTLIDHTILSLGELSFNRKLISNIPLK